MIVEVRAKNQMTIPKEISKSLGINMGDQFDMIEKEYENDKKNGKVKIFSNTNEMLAYLHGKR